ncbi:MAG TPA: YqgE/AlgH family protein [Bryobacteraceae bacterium]|jgi:putative transcriptional regulator|nr:YqgE/AlgH family protein [Bryobacteraceae bacterium]
MARLIAACLLFACVPLFCQTDDLAVGQLLVASRDLGDPNFAKTVILLVHYSEGQGAVGLVLNKRTDVPISRVFHDMKEAGGRKDPVYIGGPVELNSVLALLKSASKPEGTNRVFGDVYLISNKDLLTQTLGSGVEAAVFHTYIGYAGWGAGQLEHEVDLGAWHIMPADAGTVFHADPDSVWERLIHRTETQIAQSVTYTPPLPSLARR